MELKVKPLAAELIGTFMLMSAVLGAAFYAFNAPSGAAGILGVAFSLGLTVMALIRSIGQISGGHYNPAVTLGLVAGGRFPAGDAVPYIIAQCAGAVLATLVFSIIGHNPASYAANGFGDLSMLKASLVSVFLLETVLTAFFLMVIMGSTRAGATPGFAPLSIGLALAATQIIAIPISNASINPARSLGSAVFAGGEALSQLWVFWAAPVLGAVIGALIYRWLADEA